MNAIVLAGGKGTRLLPYTIVIPKPMLPISGMPIIEIISRQLKYYGFESVTVSLGHLSSMIKIFLEGKENDIRLPRFSFFVEEDPLGTSGPIKAINPNCEDFLVINGDILSSINLKALMESHKASGAILTISARKAQFKLPFGALTVNTDNNVVEFKEKPVLDLVDNIGVYVYSKRALNYIVEGEKLDIDILFQRLMNAGEKVNAYRQDGPYFWIDIGTHADYEKACAEFESVKNSFPFLVEESGH